MLVDGADEALSPGSVAPKLPHVGWPNVWHRRMSGNG